MLIRARITGTHPAGNCIRDVASGAPHAPSPRYAGQTLAGLASLPYSRRQSCPIRLTRVLVDALYEAAAKPLRRARGEQVAAANPYGCNQYGEGWKKPHNGVSCQRKGEAAKDEWKDGEWRKFDVTDNLCRTGKGKNAPLVVSESGKATMLYIKPKGEEGFTIWVPMRCVRGNTLSLNGGMKFRKTYRDGSTRVTVGEISAQELSAMLGGPLDKKSEHVSAKHCNQYYCPHKGTTREKKTPKVHTRVFTVNQSEPLYKQVNALIDALVKASQDGVRLEAVITRPEFGELTLNCGRPGRKNDNKDSRGVGVQHALEKRHGITIREIAETLLLGKVTQSKEMPERLEVRRGKVLIILNKEMHQHSGRVSRTKAKIQTAMHA